MHTIIHEYLAFFNPFGTMVCSCILYSSHVPHVLNRLVVGKYQKNPSLSQRDVQGVHTIWNVLVFDFEGNLQRGLCSFILGIFDSLHPCPWSDAY